MKTIFAGIFAIKIFNGHPWGFYKKCGYETAGVIPNATGQNKPGIRIWKNLSIGD